MIKAILFDIDNTLIDFMTMKHKSCRAALNAMIHAGLDMEKEEAIKILFELYDKHGYEHKEIFQKFLKKTHGKVDYRIVAHGVIAYRKLQDSYLIPYQSVIPTLIKLSKKYKLAVVTDAPRFNAWMRLVEMNLDEFFEVVITAADARKQKTYAAPFKAALKKLKIKPEEALMVGDRIERDVETANKLGVNTCFARYGMITPPTKGKSGAKFEIENFKELLELPLDKIDKKI